MFQELTDKLDGIFKNLRGQGMLTEKNIKDSMRDIRRALLEADVNFKVARTFVKHVEEKVLGKEVLTSITPGQLVVKCVHDELTEILGGTAVTLTISGGREVIMVCGLQGSGKTTTVTKLAKHLEKLKRKPVVSSVDVHRPAAIDQLRVMSNKYDIPFIEPDNMNPAHIASKCVDVLKNQEYDVLILDTAGRLHIDEDMMNELAEVREIVTPNHVLFVADGMTGQDAVNAVKGFIDYTDFDGVILTKLDSDTRGGAALSIREVTKKPILFVGTGEKPDAFDVFYPERLASRILGMGDVVSLVEKAQEAYDEKSAKALQEKMMTDGLTLEDFLNQLNQIKKMGPLDQLLGMIPGVGKAMKGVDVSGDELKHVEAIILSMTKEERSRPNIINGSRRRRIADGSGTSVQEVNNLLKQFHAMQKMMKKLPKMAGFKKPPKDMNLPY